jgi:hypothetical protein
MFQFVPEERLVGSRKKINFFKFVPEERLVMFVLCFTIFFANDDLIRSRGTFGG